MPTIIIDRLYKSHGGSAKATTSPIPQVGRRPAGQGRRDAATHEPGRPATLTKANVASE